MGGDAGLSSERRAEGPVGYDSWGADWRQRDYDVLASAEFNQAPKDNGVTLVTWREIQKAMYP